MLSQSQIAAYWGPPCSGLRATVSLHGAGKVTVRAAIVDATKALNQCLINWNYRTRYADTGAFVCLAGETEILTRQGIKRIEDLVGQDVEVLTRRAKGGHAKGGPGTWTKTRVESYGPEALRKITLSSSGIEKIIYATSHHRWYTKGDTTDPKVAEFECITDELKPGFKLSSLRPQSIASRTTPSPIGIAAGLVFGDGTLDNQQARIQLFGSKNIKFLKYFSTEQTVDYYNDDEKYSEEYCIVRGLPRSWKTKGPDIDDGPAYLYGWLAGYFAADGRITKEGAVELNSYKQEDLQLARDIALRCGITTRPITKTEKKVTPPGSDKEYKVTQYNLNFHKKYLDESFFLVDEHRTRFMDSTSDREPNRWKIVSVEETDRFEEVYCVDVPETGCFTLADDILTGNCRMKVDGGGWSNHSYATAIDINWQLNPYGGTKHNIPNDMAAAICRIKTNNGAQVWNWGGFWTGTRDWMHFEIVCKPSDIATGINWNTVAGAKPVPPKPIDYVALRKWVAADLEKRVSGLPTMWLDNAPHPLYVVTLRQALNLVLNEKLPEDGIYDADQDWQVQRFQKNLNKLVPGAIKENLGTFGPQTKWWLVLGLRNIRDGLA